MPPVARKNKSMFVEPLEGRQLFAVAAPAVSADVSQLVFNDVVGGGVSPSRTVTLKNTGNATLTIPIGGVTINGAAAGQFKTPAFTAATKVAPGGTLKLGVNFGATSLGPKGATLTIKSNAANAPALVVTLRGLGTRGLQGSNEPSLQWILDTYQIPVNVGDDTPGESTIPLPSRAGTDEIVAQMFKKAGPGDVTVTPIAIFSNPSNPGAIVGWYTTPGTGAAPAKTQLYTVPSADVQTLNPRTVGSQSFDPGVATFGLYSTWPAQANRTVYSEDYRNTFIQPVENQRMFTTFPLRNPDGSVVPNAYVVGNEEAFNNDQQDAVFIVRNVVPLLTADPPVVEEPTTPTEPADPATPVDEVPTEPTTPAEPTTPPEATQPPAVTPPPVVGPPVVETPVVVTPPVVVPPPAVTPPAAPVVYKASSAAQVGAKLAKDNAGYTGTAGYIDFQNNAGDRAAWTVTRTAAGTATLTFRYANGSKADRPLELKVNGVVVRATLAMPPTGSWTTWKTVTLTVNLVAGANTVQLATTGLNGANVDSLTVA